MNQKDLDTWLKWLEDLPISQEDRTVLITFTHLQSKKLVESKQKVSHKIDELISAWQKDKQYIDRLLTQLEQAQQSEALSAKALADWLKPENARDDEVFHFWTQNTLLEIQGDRVSIR